MKKNSGFALVGLLIVLVPAVCAQDGRRGIGAEGGRALRGFDRGQERMERFRGGEGREKIVERMQEIVEEPSTEQPEIKTYLEELKSSDRPRKRMFMKHLFRDFPGKGILQNSDVKPLVAKHLKLELESLVLAEEIHQGEGDITAKKERLQSVLTESFEQKQQLRANRLKHLEEILKQSTEEVSYRNEHKESIINQRYEMLLEEQDQISW